MLKSPPQTEYFRKIGLYETASNILIPLGLFLEEGFSIIKYDF
jgi:hypothetical protein